MSKKFDVIMAGVIASIVVVTTYTFGIAGTAMGSVIGSMIFQFFSQYVKAPLEDAKVKHVEREIVFIFPLFFIIIIELIFALLLVSYQFPQSSLDYHTLINIFLTLENATRNNLFRILGISLIIMSIYPILQPKVIKKEYGMIITSLGIVLFLRGLIDVNDTFTKFYRVLFQEFDLLFAILIPIVLIIITFLILKDSLTILKGRFLHKEDIEVFDRVNLEEKKERHAKYSKFNIKTSKGKRFHRYDNIELDSSNNDYDRNNMINNLDNRSSSNNNANNTNTSTTNNNNSNNDYNENNRKYNK